MTAIVILSFLICMVNSTLVTALLIKDLGIPAKRAKDTTESEHSARPEVDEVEMKRKKRAYEETEQAFQELMNYNAEQAYGIASSAEEE